MSRAGGGSARPAERAFVLHLRADADLDGDRLAARVEHVVSGRTVHVDSLADLLGFLREVLREQRQGGGE
jgi:hypothetical protein